MASGTQCERCDGMFWVCEAHDEMGYLRAPVRQTVKRPSKSRPAVSLIRSDDRDYRQDREERARIDGPRLILEPSTAQPIALTLHELATNAAKYGALSVPEGYVEVTWSRSIGGTLVLRWTESDGPQVSRPTRRGFGTSLTERVIEGLNGKIRLDWRAEGLRCEITVCSHYRRKRTNPNRHE